MSSVFAAFLMALQVFVGRVDVTIEDSTGGRLPGVTVTIEGPASQTTTTDEQGRAHFLNLPVGTYTVKTSLSGFNPYTNTNVDVAAGAAVDLPVRMALAGTTENVEVTAATPLIDTKKETTTTHVTLEELQNVPSARDPWVVMQSVPTVYVDRVNVGGSESGQQSIYFAKGAQTTDNTWNLDGIPITDMGATGSSPTYYDFDVFQEMAVTTGGADAQNPTPGVQLSMVLKKGSNTPHGSARVYFENQSLQANNLSPDLAATIGGTTGKGNRTDRYIDDGFEMGGPIVKDRLWAWGSIGRTDIRNLTLNDALDATLLENYAFKADAQVNNSTRLNFAFFRGNKTKQGRNVSPTHPAETGWNQTGPTPYYKGEGNFVIGQSLVASVRAAHVRNGFTLTPAGGMNTNYYLDDSGVWHNSFYMYSTDRPSNYVGADASRFAGRHEVKFGFSWRRTPVESLTAQPGSKIVTIWNGYPNMLARPTRDYPVDTSATYINGFVTDTIAWDRVTLVAGARVDRQTSSLSAMSVPGVPGFAVLPPLNAPAVDNVFKWTTVTPRVGVTYALDPARNTIVRGSYAMFASQLPANYAKFLSPIQYSYAYYNAVDRNGDGIAEQNEINFGDGLQGYGGFDPANPSALTTYNKVDPNMHTPITHEILGGFDRQLPGQLVVSGTFTYRRFTNLLWSPRVGVTQQDYTLTGYVTGTFPTIGAVNAPYYAINQSAIPPGGGREYETQPGYHQRYLGLEASAVKRLSNRWMARFGFSTNDWREYFDDPSVSIEDPTRAPAATPFGQAQPTAGPLQSGGLVVQPGKSGIYLLPPQYQISANGSYQAPWGINLGANLVSRQGYGAPYFYRTSTHDPLIAKKNVLLVNNIDDYRLPAVTSFDARVEKMFTFGKVNLAADFDVFNLFNAGTVLRRQYDASTGSAFDSVLEIMNPRIARVGVRVTF
jgi:hypothetical protein